MFQKPDREGGPARKPALADARASDTRSVESYDMRAGCFMAPKFLGIEGPVVCFAIGPFLFSLCPLWLELFTTEDTEKN